MSESTESSSHLVFFFSVEQLYSGRGESRASSGGADERCRGGGAAPSTGRQTEGQEAKQQESEEEGRSCEASSQTLSPDGQQEQETSCTSTGSKKTRDGVNGNNMEGQSDQYLIRRQEII